ncbi:MAG: hypothetical protein M3Q54_08365 [Actinomycetota bacterium]|jgi:hypothetical protein|nr:hypothetical protein [Actinomycetota bacterium]
MSEAADMQSLAKGGTELRVLMANEPRSYRDGLAAVLRELRPGIEVTTVEPDVLDGSILRLTPDIVVCNRATGVVRQEVPVWLELYPDFASWSVVSVRGARSTLAEIQLLDILSIVDQTASV